MAKLRYSALIAAAGRSQRMGFPKSLFPTRGKTAALYLAEQFYLAQVHDIFISLPIVFNGREKLKNELQTLAVKIIANHFDHVGYAGSIKSVLRDNLDDNCDGLFIAPIDVLMSKTLILSMINCAQSLADHPLIIVPYCHLRPGHPVFISHHFFSELQSSLDHEALYQFIKRFNRFVLKLWSFDPQILLNRNARSSEEDQFL